jgi:subtilisin family serine protease
MKNNTSRIARLLGIAAFSLAVCLMLPLFNAQQNSDSSSDAITRPGALERTRLLQADAGEAVRHHSLLNRLIQIDRRILKQEGRLLQTAGPLSYALPSRHSGTAGSSGLLEGMPAGTVLVRDVPVHPSRVMVRVREGVSEDALKAAMENVGASAVSDPNPARWLTVDLPDPSIEMEAAGGESLLLSGMKALQASGVLEAVEPDFLVSRTVAPNDQGLTQGWLWGLQNAGQDGGTEGIDIGAVKAWDTTTGSKDIIVAVIDTGIRYTHQELVGQMWSNPDEIPGNGVDDDNDGYIDNVHGVDTVNFDGDPMDDNGHGTHCAGTIGAAANDGNAHVGVAWEVSLMACKFLSAEGWGYTSGAISGIDFAVSNGAQILSNSWGGGGHSQALYDAIVRARDEGVVFLAAAGNSGLDTDSQPHYPSSYDVENIIAVSAIDRHGQLASWSNYGKNTVDVGAPGVDIFSSVSDSDSSYAYYSGTSMATPHVAGVVALMLANNAGLSATEAKAQLLSTSVVLDSLEGRTVSGGLVNAAAALGGGNDGQLELGLRVSETPLRGGRSVVMFATLTNNGPVIGADIIGTMNGEPLDFSDDGKGVDKNAGDGIYSATVEVPMDRSIVEAFFEVAAAAGELSPVSRSLTVPVIHPPANDHFDERAGLSGRKVLLDGFSNIGATAEEEERRHYYFAPEKTVWFTWTAPRSGRADLWLRGSEFDTILAVYRGNTFSRLRRVARDDDSGGKLTSRVRFNVRKGRAYQFVIDGWNGAEGEIDGRLVVKKRKPFKRNKQWWRWN